MGRTISGSNRNAGVPSPISANKRNVRSRSNQQLKTIRVADSQANKKAATTTKVTTNDSISDRERQAAYDNAKSFLNGVKGRVANGLLDNRTMTPGARNLTNALNAYDANQTDANLEEMEEALEELEDLNMKNQNVTLENEKAAEALEKYYQEHPTERPPKIPIPDRRGAATVA